MSAQRREGINKPTTPSYALAIGLVTAKLNIDQAGLDSHWSLIGRLPVTRQLSLTYTDMYAL